MERTSGSPGITPGYPEELVKNLFSIHLIRRLTLSSKMLFHTFYGVLFVLYTLALGLLMALIKPAGWGVMFLAIGVGAIALFIATRETNASWTATLKGIGATFLTIVSVVASYAAADNIMGVGFAFVAVFAPLLILLVMEDRLEGTPA